MTAGIKANADGSAAIQVGGSDAITITSGLVVSMNGGPNYPLLRATAVASTSGTSIDFTGIPSWVDRITVMFSGVSTNGTTGFSVQLGDAGGIETTGYAVGTSNSATSTQEFPLTGGSGAAAGIYHGQCVISLIGTNIWSVMAVVARSDTSIAFSMGGSKTLSDTLTQVRIKTGNGTDTFDAGSINILYE
jgi:hypothetical protein